MKKRIFSFLLVLCLLFSSASALSVEQAREILKTYYIDEIPEEVLALPTVEEILDALGDVYTTYYDEETFQAILASMEDTQIVGIGIISYYVPEGLLLDTIAPDSPASEAGLQAGDCIIAVGGNLLQGAEDADVDQWLQGDENGTLRLTILRGEETFDVTVTRREVVFPTVTLDKIENRIGWITCTAFGSTTFQHFYDIITAHDDEVDEWIVDLRDNGGGEVIAAVFSASCFAGWDSGVYLRDGSGKYYAYLSDPISMLGLYGSSVELSAFDQNGYLTTDPVYVLTSENTASASELFCSAIRDSGAGLIIGERTFGKGVAQTLFNEDYTGDTGNTFDGDALRVTTERGYSTAGATYDKVGVLPHFLVSAELADEAAALLAAPVSDEEDALYLRNVSFASQLVHSMVLPLDELKDPANAEIVSQLLSAVPPSATCQLRVDGVVTNVTSAQAAQACGVTLEGRTFSDVEQSEYSLEIQTLGVYGIVDGVGNGIFQPKENLDRASLCALLVKAMRYPLSEGESAFADVPADEWYAPYINALYEAGVVHGYDDGLFHPDDPISHEEFLVILGRTAQWLDMDLYEVSRHNGIYGDKMPYADALARMYPDYADWAREQVWLCDDTLVWDDLSQVDPAAPTIREEAAAAIYNLFWYAGTLPC